MRRALVVGNWKMHGTRQANAALIGGLTQPSKLPGNVDVAVCPPFPYLRDVGAAIEGLLIGLGAQNVAVEGSGAYTGEVSAAMLADVGCRYVIVGHSERRHLYGEDDATVAAKVTRAVEATLVPIVCVGETLEQREAGDTLAVIERQLSAVLGRCPFGSAESVVFAYEPVWAIGTGCTATPAQAQEVHGSVRALVAKQSAIDAATVRILYGGSVKPDNAAALFAEVDIDGALVGGASLSATDFAAICSAAG